MNHAAPGAILGGPSHTGASDHALAATLKEVTVELRSAGDPHRALATVTEALTGTLADCTIAVLLGDADGLRVAAASSDSLPALLSVDAACTDGPASSAYHSGRPVSCHRIPRRGHEGFNSPARAAGFRSAYGLPVRHGAARLGALLVLSGHAEALDDDVLKGLGALAEAIGAALHRREDARGARASWRDVHAGHLGRLHGADRVDRAHSDDGDRTKETLT